MRRWKDGDTYYVARANALETTSRFTASPLPLVRSSSSKRRREHEYSCRSAGDVAMPLLVRARTSQTYAAPDLHGYTNPPPNKRLCVKQQAIQKK